MLHLVAKKLAQIFVHAGVVPPEDEDIYIYGWEMIIATGSGFLTMLLLSFFIDSVLSSIVFIFSLFFLRIYSGGYHAVTFLGCYITTTCLYILSALLISFIPGNLVSVVTLTLIVLSLIILFIRAPQDHPNRPIQEGEEAAFRKKTRIIALIETFLALVGLFIFPQFAESSLWISFAMSITAILLIFPINKTKLQDENS